VSGCYAGMHEVGCREKAKRRDQYQVAGEVSAARRSFSRSRVCFGNFRHIKIADPPMLTYLINADVMLQGRRALCLQGSAGELEFSRANFGHFGGAPIWVEDGLEHRNTPQLDWEGRRDARTHVGRGCWRGGNWQGPRLIAPEHVGRARGARR
jgi:hypothetical protein